MWRAERGSRALAAVALVALSAALPSCFCGDSCDDPLPLPPSGHYVGASTRMAITFLAPTDGSAGLRVASDRQLHFDRERGLVRVSYERDGKRVEETWRVRSRSIRYLQ